MVCVEESGHKLQPHQCEQHLHLYLVIWQQLLSKVTYIGEREREGEKRTLELHEAR